MQCGLGSFAFALKCSEPVLRAAGGVYASAKQRFVPKIAVALVDSAEKVALDAAKYGYERTAVGAVVRKAMSVLQAAAAGDVVLPVVSKTTDIPGTVKLTVAAGRPLPAAEVARFDGTQPTANSSQANVYVPAGDFKGVFGAVVKGGMAAVREAVQKGSTEMTKASQLLKTSLSTTKNKAERWTSTAFKVTRDVLGVLKAGLQLAGCVLKAAFKLTAVFLSEGAKDVAALSKAAIWMAAARMSPKPTPAVLELPQQLPERRIQRADIIFHICIWLCYVGGFSIILALLAGY